MVRVVSSKELILILKAFYKQKDTNNNRKYPLLIYGTFGIGKSFMVLDTAKEIGEKKEKKFVEWNRLSTQEKEEVTNNPKNYFVYMDIRLSEFDAGDFKLPDFKRGENDDTFIWKSPLFSKLLCNPDSDGFLVFEEISLATPLVISSTYKILYDRCFNDNKIGDNWLIVGITNKDDDLAYTHQLASPVKDRGGELELLPPTNEEWVDWAIRNGIDSRIIGFINFKPSYLHKVDFEDNQKYTTHRGWARVSHLINGVDDFDTLELLSSTAIGEGIAREFSAFCKIKEAIKLDEIIKNPELMRNLTDVGFKYFIVSALAEQYKTSKIVDFAKIMKFSEVMDSMKNQEMVALLWRLCIKYNPVKFGKEFTEKEINHPLKQKYKEYILD